MSRRERARLRAIEECTEDLGRVVNRLYGLGQLTGRQDVRALCALLGIANAKFTVRPETAARDLWHAVGTLSE